jgi:ABC-2 type transport system ATP-binding protein
MTERDFTDRNTVLAVRDLQKQIGKKLIIKGVSFTVREGEIFGFLGPNGSGKTTTIRMLVDLIKPTSGAIEICGYDVQKQHNQALRYVGCIVENPELYGYMTGWQNLEHYARMLPDVGERRIREVVDIVGMDQRIHDKVKTYSLGMRQRLGIAQALLCSPKLLILDEPTNGLDPAGIKELREFIRKLADEGLSIFISSHLLSEIQLMCDRVAIISHGRVLFEGGVEEMISQARKLVVWHVAAGAGEQARLVLSNTSNVKIVDEPLELEGIPVDTENTVLITEMDQSDVPALNRQLVAGGIDVLAIEMKNPTLEQLFLTMTAGEKIE